MTELVAFVIGTCLGFGLAIAGFGYLLLKMDSMLAGEDE